MQYTIYDFTGNLGVALIIGLYLLLQIKYLDSDSLWYSLGNGIGAVLVIISLLENFNLSSFVIEIFWIIISVIGIFNYFRRQRREVKEKM